eukprot:CAMPEP_0171146204 /NCGR_PEP_ID=MMETSP0766_2-20121228/147448_1 /TAXON_ID=439317 /ORGANISM="Gambierdiscus australes, Strain CAWD 149" /LENGTH=187 /DNA_ID=CAMNT_0011610109 /DNA_START=63 /DNA_END=629 /DNA_ORIENTATION=-
MAELIGRGCCSAITILVLGCQASRATSLETSVQASSLSNQALLNEVQAALERDISEIQELAQHYPIKVEREHNDAYGNLTKAEVEREHNDAYGNLTKAEAAGHLRALKALKVEKTGQEAEVGGSTTGFAMLISLVVVPLSVCACFLFYRRRLHKLEALEDEPDELAEVWVQPRRSDLSVGTAAGKDT